MSATKSLIDLAITGQSTALLAENYKVAKHSFATKKIKTPKGVETKKLLGLGIKNILGIELLKTQAQLASGL